MGESVGRLGVFKARLYYERLEWSLAIEAADTVMADTQASEMDQIRALMLKALSLSPADIDRLTLLETAETKLDDSDTIIEDSNRQLLKGEVLNNLGREYMRHRPEKAEATLQKAYQLNRDSGARSLRSRAISAGALGDLYHFASGVPRNADIARSYYEENLQLSRNMGDLAGLIRMTSLEANLLLNGKISTLLSNFTVKVYIGHMVVRPAIHACSQIAPSHSRAFSMSRPSRLVQNNRRTRLDDRTAAANDPSHTGWRVHRHSRSKHSLTLSLLRD